MMLLASLLAYYQNEVMRGTNCTLTKHYFWGNRLQAIT